MPSICLAALKVIKPPEGAELFVGLPRLAGWDNEWNDSLGRFAGCFAGASLGCRSRLEPPLETLMVSAHSAPHRPSDQGL